VATGPVGESGSSATGHAAREGDRAVPHLAQKISVANSTLLVDGNLTAVTDFFGPGYIAHATDREIRGGPDAVRRFVESYRRAFSDLEVDVQILVESTDRVAWQRTLRGTHRAAYKGFPATGGKIVWRDMATSRFEDGLIAEDWVISDLAEQLLRARHR
jgi:steroid delta-isomerase-like uncharacterized protein